VLGVRIRRLLYEADPVFADYDDGPAPGRLALGARQRQAPRALEEGELHSSLLKNVADRRPRRRSYHRD